MTRLTSAQLAAIRRGITDLVVRQFMRKWALAEEARLLRLIRGEAA